MNDTRTIARSEVSVVSYFMQQVYLWMAIGLGLTAFVAWAVAGSPAALSFIFGNTFVLIGLIVAEFALVIAISAAVHKLSAATATGLFMLYSALNGATLSSVLIVYTASSVANAFLATAGTFVAMSVYGTVTKRDLTSWGSFLFMGLIGIVIASLVNIFLKSTMMEFVISCIGVLVFVGLTAYDTQKIRQFALGAPLDDSTAVRRGVILSALSLYLDFINLFLMILRLFGSRD